MSFARFVAKKVLWTITAPIWLPFAILALITLAPIVWGMELWSEWKAEHMRLQRAKGD